MEDSVSNEEPNDHIMCPIHPEGHPIWIGVGGIMGAIWKDRLLRQARAGHYCVREDGPVTEDSNRGE